ncbi:MAG: hypothetical protein RL514_3147 [Verrucomicrobiota bacterium]|jgi:hypothetical protein
MSVMFQHSKLGVVTTLRVDAPELEELAGDLHSSARVGRSECSAEASADLAWQPSADGQWHILLKGAVWRGATLSKEELFLQSDSLLDDLVREHLQEFPILHAGGVVDSAGRAAVICGSSGAGKTSLVTACVLRGWSWLSDERLCFRQADPTAVEGFRRNFNLKERSFATFPETDGLPGTRELVRPGNGKRIRFFNADQLPGGKFVPGGNVRVIILPEYVPAATVPVAATVSGVDFVSRLVPELRTTHTRTVTWLAELGRQLPVFTLRYSEPRAAAACLEEVLKGL